MNYRRPITLIAVCLILTGLHLNSTTWLRLKLADYRMQAGDYDRAVPLYKKALRKENLTFKYRPFISGGVSKANSISLRLTDAYFKSAEQHLNRADFYSETIESGTSNLKLLDKAMREYGKTAELYEDYKNAFTFIPEEISQKWDAIVEESKDKKIAPCFAAGEQYIKNGMWQEAKTFYAKEIVKYINPAIALEELNRRYNIAERPAIKEKIWGDEIFVSLEDFEDSAQPIIDWRTRNSRLTINNHVISKEASHAGSHSEYFDFSYSEEGYDYWVKPVDIPLNRPEPALGVRVFVKGEKPFKGGLKLNVTYPEPYDKSPVLGIDTKKDTIGTWQERRIDNLFEVAKAAAVENNWSMKEARIENIVIDTGGISNRFYIDDIELYLINSAK